MPLAAVRLLELARPNAAARSSASAMVSSWPLGPVTRTFGTAAASARTSSITARVVAILSNTSGGRFSGAGNVELVTKGSPSWLVEPA